MLEKTKESCTMSKKVRLPASIFGEILANVFSYIFCFLLVSSLRLFGAIMLVLMLNALEKITYLLLSFSYAQMPIPLLIYGMFYIALIYRCMYATIKKQKTEKVYERLIYALTFVTYIVLYFYIPLEKMFTLSPNINRGLAMYLR